MKKRLEDQEARVSAFKRRHIGENPKNMDSNLAVLDRLTAQLRLNSDNQNRALERREALARQFAGSDGLVPHAVGVSGTEPADPATVRLARLHQELAELQTRFSDKYPDVVRLKADIAVLETQLRTAPRQTASAPAQPEVAPESIHLQASAGASPKSRRRSPPFDRRSGGFARISLHTSAAWRTRRSGSRSSRSCLATTRRRASCTGRCSSATRRRSSPRPWSSGRRASSSAFSRRRSRRAPRRRRTGPAFSSSVGVLSMGLGSRCGAAGRVAGRVAP